MRRDELLRRRGATGQADSSRCASARIHPIYLTGRIDMFIQCGMPKEMTAFRIDPQIMDGLRRVKDRDGVPLSIQVDRALRAWLQKKGVSVAKPKAARSNRRRLAHLNL
jgi:hypothetical protein